MDDLWVFGYGSLMWKPEFSYLESQPALMVGVHRALCVYSWVHRGTQDRPGLVLGLDSGGSCRGVGFRIAGADWERVVGALRAREQVTGVYKERYRPLTLVDGRKVNALVYVVDRNHAQYAGRLEPIHQVDLIRGATGRSGANPEYVLRTNTHLNDLGIIDHQLDWICRRLRAG